MSIFQRIWGGWKTQGIAEDAGFASDSPSGSTSVTEETAMRLSAVWACQHLRAETIGTMPLHLRDGAKKSVTDHPAYNLLRNSPNADMTAPEYWSLATAHEDMHGNFLSVIERRPNKEPIALLPIDPRIGVTDAPKKSGVRQYKVGQEIYPADRILHLRGFSMDGLWGAPRLHVGRQIIAAQLDANDAAMRAFQQGLKVGGFLTVDNNLTKEQRKDLEKILRDHSSPEKAGTMLALLKGMQPIPGKDYRVTPVEADLLPSRYFGIEEICRLYNTPPQLIGHTDKASSWASSLETLDLFFLTYSVLPTLVRNEARIAKQLLTPYDIAKGIQPKFLIDGLRRTDLATRTAFYASGLQNGYLNRNEVRDLEERGSIEGGDKYTVQLNMTSADSVGKNPPGGKKP